MMNIGQRPTFGGHRTTLEVHILGYRGDLYGKSIDIEFVERLRDEQYFESAEALVRQMEEDARRTRMILDHELRE
jgi:riboflavin kinase/FMN adenylyltransferase